MQVTDEMIVEWKKQHGEVLKLSGEVSEETGQEEFYFRKPARKDLARFAKEAVKDIMKGTNNLVYACLLYPNGEDLKQRLEEKPGLILALGSELQKVVGSNTDFLSTTL